MEKFTSIRINDNNELVFTDHDNSKSCNCKYKICDTLKVKVNNVPIMGKVTFIYQNNYEIDFGENSFLKFSKHSLDIDWIDKNAIFIP